MWDMSSENRQQLPLERGQQVCMLRLTTPHNPKGPAARWAASRPDRGGSRDRRFKSCPRNQKSLLSRLGWQGFSVMEHDVSPRPFRLGARAHNPKGECVPVARKLRADRGGSRDRRFKSCPRNHVAANPCGSPHFSAQNAASPFRLPLLPAKSLAAPALFACKRAHDVPACYQLFADFPTFPQPGTGRARRPACSFFSSLLPPDPYLTHTVFPWV